ncbi:MAG: hypothetical protein KA368_22445 [Acidobacteria bacterium]|nr:hypothetical protein [Acidobacteriota bacterium]
MKVRFQLLIHCFALLLLNSLSSLGQIQPPPPPPTPPRVNVPTTPARGPDLDRKAEEYNRKLEAEMRRRALNNRKSGAVLPIVLTEDELTSDERKALTPTSEDLKANAEFLRQSGTGIFRLMRVDKQNHRKVVSADNLAVSGDVLLVGGGAQYSFTKKNHNADKWSDMAWDEDWFLGGVGGQAIGVLVDLGDVSLESVNLESTGLGYLAKFVPATTESAAEKQFQQLEKGETDNGFNYRLSALWKLNTTYALRSVNYDRSDLLVAFRAVRQDQNGSLIVLWKKLNSYGTPKLKKDRKN